MEKTLHVSHISLYRISSENMVDSEKELESRRQLATPTKLSSLLSLMKMLNKPSNTKKTPPLISIISF